MQELGLPDLASYRTFLDAHPSEWAEFDSCCRVTISRFSRDQAVFAFLGREVLPALAAMVRDRGGNELRCWSIGAASGEEAYSLAVLWHHAACPDRTVVLFTVLGTEADRALVDRAMEGCYRQSSLKELPREWVREGFVRRGEQYCLREELKRNVSFSAQDVRREMPEGPFHLICCRNLVFTYFDEALQKEMLDRITDRMVPGGALVIGAHESLPGKIEGLVSWSDRCRTFRKS
jgi:chemotaxis protein methyltransferase CheR